MEKCRVLLQEIDGETCNFPTICRLLSRKRPRRVPMERLMRAYQFFRAVWREFLYGVCGKIMI